MPKNLQALLDELLTVDDLLAGILSAVAVNVDLSNVPQVAQALTTALAAVSVVGLIIHKIKETSVGVLPTVKKP